METTDFLKDARFQLFLALGATTPLILASVSRWYKEWYFAQFRVHYGLLRFDWPYYVFGSWATMLVSVASIAIVLNAWLHFTVPSPIWTRVVAIGLCALTVVRVLFLRLQFAPGQSFVTKLATSADLTVVCIGMVAFSQGAMSHSVRSTADKVMTTILTGSPMMWWAGLFAFWTYCIAVGYALGTYHGRKAIWQGKMGLQWVTLRAENRRWILVEQADEDRVFVFDRDRQVARFIKRDDIEEMQERVGPVSPQDRVEG